MRSVRTSGLSDQDDVLINGIVQNLSIVIERFMVFSVSTNDLSGKIQELIFASDNLYRFNFHQKLINVANLVSCNYCSAHTTVWEPISGVTDQQAKILEELRSHVVNKTLISTIDHKDIMAFSESLSSV